MTDRLNIIKTYKLYIGGQLPRSESGRSLEVKRAGGDVCAHVCHGSRKDFRDGVEAARKAQSGWADRTGYNRGQILYRMGEMLEGRRAEFIDAIATTIDRGPRNRKRIASEIDTTIDRLVSFAGWADKFQQVLGCQNPVAGPYYNFTVPEPTGVVVVLPPDEPPLLGLVSLLAAVIVSGNAAIVVVGHKNPLPAAIFAEVCATSDVPAGVINIITSKRSELIEHIAPHREVNAISAANVTKAQRTTLEAGAAENLKRVHVVKRAHEDWLDDQICSSPSTIEPFVEMKTIWHPSAV